MGRTPPGQTRERVYRYVAGRLLAGTPPTVREVRDAFGFRSVSAADEHLNALVKEGRLAKDAEGRHRAYRLLPEPAQHGPVLQVPILGRVQAGALTTAVQDIEGYLAVHSRLPPEELFALKVRGESMVGAGILPGDLVVVRRQSMAQNGDIVVALVGDEATVKTLRRTRGRVELHAANPAFAPIVPNPEEVVVLGKVIEVRRHLMKRAGK